MANENEGGIVVTSPKELIVPQFSKSDIESIAKEGIDKNEIENIALGVASKKNVYKFKAVVVGREDDSYISLPLQSIKGLPKAIYIKGANFKEHTYLLGQRAKKKAKFN